MQGAPARGVHQRSSAAVQVLDGSDAASAGGQQCRLLLEALKAPAAEALEPCEAVADRGLTCLVPDEAGNDTVPHRTGHALDHANALLRHIRPLRPIRLPCLRERVHEVACRGAQYAYNGAGLGDAHAHNTRVRVNACSGHGHRRPLVSRQRCAGFR